MLRPKRMTNAQQRRVGRVWGGINDPTSNRGAAALHDITPDECRIGSGPVILVLQTRATVAVQQLSEHVVRSPVWRVEGDEMETR